MDMYSYQDEEPLNSPRRRVRGKRPELDTTDQIAQAQWTHPQGNQLAPAVAAPPGYVPPPGSPASIPPATGAAPPGVAAPAPPFAAPPAIAIGGNSPLAQGFVDLVNSKFDGDISRALFDPEARSWARSIGLVDNDQVFNADLSDERIGLIERVLRDRTLTAPTKIHSVKLLLHN
jgi:hypothetical protein